MTSHILDIVKSRYDINVAFSLKAAWQKMWCHFLNFPDCCSYTWLYPLSHYILYYLFICACLLVDWFVSRMTRKLLNWFPQNSDGGWRIDPINFWCGSGDRSRTFFLTFSLILHNAWMSVKKKKKSGLFRWLVSMKQSCQHIRFSLQDYCGQANSHYR